MLALVFGLFFWTAFTAVVYTYWWDVDDRVGGRCIRNNIRLPEYRDLWALGAGLVFMTLVFRLLPLGWLPPNTIDIGWEITWLPPYMLPLA